MRKITKYLMTLICLLTLTGCGSNTTIKEPRTIVLEVNSDVVPTFTSNFGTGTYDENTKRYTHTIDYIKDLYIFLSYDDLKTVSVHVPTSDMKDKVITKSVEFGEILDAEIEVTIEGVKTLEGLEIINSEAYSNLKIGNKNKFKFTVPSRTQDYNLKFTLPTYKEFNIDINKEDLVSGSAKIDTIALTEDQIYIAFEGKGYEYKIYSMATNELVASDNNYENVSGTTHIALPNTTGYYVKANPNNQKPRLYKIPVNENIILDLGNNDTYSSGYLNIDYSSGYYTTRLYNKNKEIISDSSSLYSSIESYGLLAEKENRWYYLEDLASKVIKDSEWEYKYTVNVDDMVEVNFDVTRINLLTNEIISSGIDNDLYISYNTKATLEDNVFHVIMEEIESGDLNIELYTKDNEKIGEVREYISSSFMGDIISGTITYEGRTIPYTFPVFLEDLTYNDEEYYYPDQIINTDISMLSIKYLDNNGWSQTLSVNDYLMDEEQDVIVGTQVGSETYFELQVGKTYTFKKSNINYSFTVTEKDMTQGFVFIINDSIRKVQVKVPEKHYLIVSEYGLTKFYPDEEGIVTLPVGDRKDFYASLSNGIVNTQTVNVVKEDGSIYEFYPFYILQGTAINQGEKYSSHLITGSNGIDYTYILANENEVVTEFETSIKKVDELGNEENYKISLNDFVYNQEYAAYYYNFEEQFDHILSFNSEYAMNEVSWSKEHYKVSYYDYIVGEWVYKAYVSNGTKIEYENDVDNISQYTFTNSDSKYLDVTVYYNGIEHQIIVSQVNN